jgi:YD repeat-containing protein
LTDPDAGMVTYNYDVANRITSLINQQSQVTTFQYDKADRRVDILRSNGTKTSFTYDSANQITSIVHKNGAGAVIASFSYTYDPGGRRTHCLEESGDRVTWTYGTANQLTLEQTGAAKTTYTYDSNGNLAVGDAAARPPRTRGGRGWSTAEPTVATRGQRGSIPGPQTPPCGSLEQAEKFAGTGDNARFRLPKKPLLPLPLPVRPNTTQGSTLGRSELAEGGRLRRLTPIKNG